MVHVYRDDRLFEGRFADANAYIGLGLLGGGFVVAAVVKGFDNGFTRSDTAHVVFLTALVIAGVAALYRRYEYRRCGEIRLSDDGLCEFETRHAVTRLLAAEIKSVKVDHESSAERYTIHLQHGRLSASERMPGFADFLQRLQTINPDIDLASFPAETWQLSHAQQPQSRASRVRRWIFPLIVGALLIGIAIHTLGSS
jgi:hypothetical protein